MVFEEHLFYRLQFTGTVRLKKPFLVSLIWTWSTILPPQSFSSPNILSLAKWNSIFWHCSSQFEPNSALLHFSHFLPIARDYSNSSCKSDSAHQFFIQKFFYDKNSFWGVFEFICWIEKPTITRRISRKMGVVYLQEFTSCDLSIYSAWELN